MASDNVHPVGQASANCTEHDELTHNVVNIINDLTSKGVPACLVIGLTPNGDTKPLFCLKYIDEKHPHHQGIRRMIDAAEMAFDGGYVRLKEQSGTE
jgi:hypothetical protein